MTEQKEIVKSEATVDMVEFTGKGVALTNLEEAWRYASLISRSGDMCPKSFRGKPEAVLAAIQRGAELGLNPMQSLTSITVIHGTPTLSGETLLALMNQPGVMKKGKRSKVGWRGEGDATEGFCWTWREGDDEPFESVFTVAEAKQAKLWMRKGREGGDTPWITMPGVMLQWRSVAKHSRKYFGDVTKGLYMTAEMRDVQYGPGSSSKAAPERDITPDTSVVTGATDPLLHAPTDDSPASEDAPPDTPEDTQPAEEVDVDTGEVIPDDVGVNDA